MNSDWPPQRRISPAGAVRGYRNKKPLLTGTRWEQLGKGTAMVSARSDVKRLPLGVALRVCYGATLWESLSLSNASGFATESKSYKKKGGG